MRAAIPISVQGDNVVRYVALVGPAALKRIDSVVGGAGSVVPAQTISDLLAAMRSPISVCAVIDPSLLTPADATAIVQQFASAPQTLVVFAQNAREAFESSIILAQGTPAQFVFQGMPNETPALAQALLLAPDAYLGYAVADALGAQLASLPPQLRATVTAMLRTGTGPQTADALALQGGMARRSMDRAFELAGLESSRFFIAATRVIRAYRAVAHSRIPFRRVAAMAGYATQRALDHHFSTFLGQTTEAIRKRPLAVEQVVCSVAGRLTTRHVSRSALRGRHPVASAANAVNAADLAPAIHAFTR